jgi:O-antigen ligase/Tfp pilus assembly protein PilF
MNRTSIQKSARQPFFYIFAAAWSFLLLANFVPALPQPEVIIGYLWKVEFALAAFLFAAIIFLLKLPEEKKEKFLRFTRKEFFLIILPLLLFTTWSGLTIFWAESARGAIHHTLLWACYGVFYLLIRQIVSQPRALAVSFKVTGLVIFILGAACIAEYVNSPEQINSFFTYRYYKYAEALLALLPIFLALALRSKSKKSKQSKQSVLAAAVALIAWLVVLLSLSRTLFISGFVAVGLFFALIFIFQDWKKHLKKSALIFGSLVLCVFISQINFSSEPENSTINRFNGSESSQASFNSRFLFWGIALEAFKQSPLVGVGADNYISVYKPARENYSALDGENKLLEINEDVLAERAHNEYLQILAELGIVGAIFFAWLLGGIFYTFLSLRKNRISLLSIASFAGISAFLISSLASSYSFRVPANGLCFFFLLALAVKSLKPQVSSPKSEESLSLGLGTWDLRHMTWDLRLPAVCGLVICASMLVFSGGRGASLMYLQFALKSSGKEESAQYFQKAIALDAQDGTFRYYYGLELYGAKRHDKAIAEIRRAIDKGVATSISYFHLASAQIVSKKTFEAEQTFVEGLRVYPRSIFLRTAFASFLLESGRNSESQTEYEKASAINAEQAKSWRLAHAEGMKKLSQIESQDKTFVKAMELKPVEGVYALLDFQRQFNPNLFRR